jgi:chorismate mutase
MMKVRGVRGATSCEANTSEAILEATSELLKAMVEANAIQEDDIASVFFTTTPDLTACFPAKAAREMGWRYTALLGATEIESPDGVPMCIRALIHWNTEHKLEDIVHVYLRRAVALRPEFSRTTS